MKAVDFHKLSRSIQDRFVGSVMSGFPPAPLLASKGATSTRGPWLGVTALSFVLLVVLTRIGYGSLESALSLHGVGLLLLYVAFVFGIVFGVVQAWTRMVRERAHPYAAGVYLFPACLIDARTDQFEVFDVRELTSVDANGASVRVTTSSGKTFVFPVADPSAAQASVQEFQRCREQALAAIASEDPKDLVAVDPLHNPRFSSPIGPRDPYAIHYPVWRTFGWAVALGVAALVAPCIWMVRNGGSETKMYAQATKANDVASFEAYLAHGRAYQAQVTDFDLPRAELRDAVRTGDVTALIAYKNAHPKSRIDGEITAEIHTAMLRELDKAKAKGTLSALDTFAKTFPEHGVDSDLRAAKHAVYVREEKAYADRAPAKNKSTVPFVEQLFGWVEQHGPAVEIRFRRKKSESLGRADKLVAASPSFAGEISYPTRYFDDKRVTEREQTLGNVLVKQFGAGLSPELFTVSLGATVGPEVEALPDVSVPTLFITHTAEWSGHTYTATKPRGVYVGIIYPFDASFVIPGNPKPFRFKADVFRPAAVSLLKENEEPLAFGQAEDMVYRVMGHEAFDQFGKKLLANFFTDTDK